MTSRLPICRGFVRRLLLSLVLLAYAGAADAAPASRDVHEEEQPDGTRIKRRLRGDEWFSWNETEDGYVIAKDTDGKWKHAVPRKNAAGFEILGDAEVGKVNPEERGLKKRDLPDQQQIREHIKARRTSGGRTKKVKGEAEKGHAAPAQPSAGSSAGPSAGEGAPTEPTGDAGEPPSYISPTAGNVKCIVVLAAFSDHWSGSTVSSVYGKTPAEYTALFNTPGYNTGGAVGSVKDYFKEVSYNKLSVDFVVTGWVKLPGTEASYGASSGDNPDTDPRKVVSDALAAAESAGFNFSQGDSDGDGWVDLLVVVHSGNSEAAGASANAMWPIQWSLSTNAYYDGVYLSSFALVSALRGTGANLMRVGTVAHEMSHLLGMPDLYDISDSSNDGPGEWSLMAHGAWGVNGEEARPVHPDAFCKALVGWVFPEEVHSSKALALPRVGAQAAVHAVADGIYVQGSTEVKEYFLIEHRGGGTGFDSALPEGLVVWHVDNKALDFTNDSGTWSHPALRLEQADGTDTLKGGGDVQASQTWSATTGLSGGFHDQTSNTYTNAMAYQGTQYTRSNNSTKYSYIRAKNFSNTGTTMTYQLETLVPTVIPRTVKSGSFSVEWEASRNATQYELQEATATTLTSFSDGAESLSDSFENWHFCGSSRSNGGASSGSYSYLLSGMDPTETYFLPKVQTMVLKKPFRTTAFTSISFKMMSNLTDTSGTLRLQASQDGGTTWVTLGTYGGDLTWATQTVSAATLQSKGIATGTEIRLRFTANIEDLYGWASPYPPFGYAVDEFALSNIEMDGYGAWVTRASSIAGTSYAITGKVNGSYGYRVRALANGAWQSYSPAGKITVSSTGNSTPWVSTITPISAGAGAAAYVLTASDLAASDPDGDTLTYSLTAAPLKGTLQKNGSSLSAGGTFTQADIAGGLVAYLPSTSSGGDSFSFTVSDGNGGTTAAASMPVTVTALVAPTVQATAVTFAAEQNALTLSWTKGNGGYRLVALKEGTGVASSPVDSASYTASTNWASKGTQLGTSGYYTVYAGTGTSVRVTGLTAYTTYTAVVFEYNGTAPSQRFLATSGTGNPASSRTLSLEPTLVTAAAASPSTVAGTYTDLSVLGNDDLGEAALTYTWSAVYTPPAEVTFSVNGTNGAKNTRATFTKAGAYTLRCTFTDTDGRTNQSDVSVTVAQTPVVTVSPATASVVAGQSQTFTAATKDQFNTAMSPTLTWSVGGGGTVDSSGVFVAGATAGGPYTLTASGAGGEGTAQVTVTSAYEAWAAALPEASRGVSGDPNGTGFTNLMAYALGLPPTRTAAQEAASLPAGVLYDDGTGSRARLTFVLPDPAPVDVLYAVEASSDMITWPVKADRTAVGVWSNGSNFTAGEVIGAGQATVTVTDVETVQSRGGVRFLRLVITQP